MARKIHAYAGDSAVKYKYKTICGRHVSANHIKIMSAFTEIFVTCEICLRVFGSGFVEREPDRARQLRRYKDPHS